MGNENCCATRKKPPVLLDLKTYVALFSELASQTENCIDLIKGGIKRMDVLDALGIYLNGLYSYLLNTQRILLSKEAEFEPKEGATESMCFDQEPIKQLKRLLDVLMLDLDGLNIAYEGKKEGIKHVVDIELSLKFLQTQLEKYNPISEHPYVGGDFSKGFEWILVKCMFSPNASPEEETKEVVEGKPHIYKNMYKIIYMYNYYRKCSSLPAKMSKM